MWALCNSWFANNSLLQWRIWEASALQVEQEQKMPSIMCSCLCVIKTQGAGGTHSVFLNPYSSNWKVCRVELPVLWACTLMLLVRLIKQRLAGDTKPWKCCHICAKKGPAGPARIACQSASLHPASSNTCWLGSMLLNWMSLGIYETDWELVPA